MLTDSIFDGVAVNENARSQLLCNLMKRVGDFRVRILGALLSHDLAVGIVPDQIETQQRNITEFGPAEAGCPDIRIKADNLYALIEVKTDPKCDLTPNQRLLLGPDRKLQGYAGFLSRQSPKKERWLVYLVPKNWVYLEQLNLSQRRLEGYLRASRINVSIQYWEEVLKADERDPFVEEFRRHMLKTLDVISFDALELDILFSEKAAGVYKLMRNAERLVDSVGALGKKSYDVHTERLSSEYGIYFKNGAGEYLLWFGVFSFFSTEYKSPVCFGIKNIWDKEGKLRAALRSVSQGAEDGGNWTLAWFGRELFQGSDPVQQVWSHLEPVLRKVAQAAFDQKALAAKGEG